MYSYIQRENEKNLPKTTSGSPRARQAIRAKNLKKKDSVILASMVDDLKLYEEE